jgi:ABC-2 type transport system permease protein
MILFKHELYKQRRSFIAWVGIMNVFVFGFMLLFPLFKEQMEALSDYMASLEDFLSVLGMGGLDLSTAEGFFGADASMLLLIGGGMYATTLGLHVLLIEEKEKTADFLLTKPVSRSTIYITKYAVGILNIFLFNVISYVFVLLSFLLINEIFPFYTMGLYFVSNFVLGIVLMTMAYGISPMIRKVPSGIAQGVAFGFYVLNSIKNVSTRLSFLQWFTPFSINESGKIFTEETLELTYILYYLGVSMIIWFIGFICYQKKDIYT